MAAEVGPIAPSATQRRHLSRRDLLRHAPLFASASTVLAQDPPSNALMRRLSTALDRLPIADTHEHLYPEPDRVAMPVDFFTLMEQGYVLSDLASAGITPAESKILRDAKASDAQRWSVFEPYWNRTRFTGYGQALRLAIRDLYRKEISAASLPAINDAIRAANQPGIYRRMLREKAKIAFCVEDDSCGGCRTMPNTPENAEFFVLAKRFDQFMIAGSPADLQALEQASGVSISSLADLKKAAETRFAVELKQGMKAIKVAVAYFRDLSFQEVQEADAARDFQAMVRQEKAAPDGFRKAFDRPFRQLEDHMFHHVMRLADAHGLPVQIHTGMFAGTGGLVTNSKPTHLINTFLLYPRVQFDIFHIGYPYQEELGVLAKSFPNVYADFCWAYVISPLAARRALSQYLDLAPINKILGFGGDFKHPELVYAHAVMARRTIAGVLAEKVAAGICTEEEAIGIGKALLFDNAERLFRSGRG